MLETGSEHWQCPIIPIYYTRNTLKQRPDLFRNNQKRHQGKYDFKDSEKYRRCADFNQKPQTSNPNTIQQNYNNDKSDKPINTHFINSFFLSYLYLEYSIFLI